MSERQTCFSIWVLVFTFSVVSLSRGAEKKEIETHHPKDWQFTMPRGDFAKGREVFQKYQCQYCHEIRGENFVFAGVDYGPELSQMGPLHPLEYFAESVINPNAVIARQYRAANGKSPMPSYNEKMSVQELIDLSTYLASLKPRGASKAVSGEGKVIALAPDADQVVIDHGEIKGFMDAMTMGYRVDPPSILEGLSAGDKVRFTLDTQQKAIVKIEKMKE
jgi:Cu/Ag efflux protein CusF